MIDFSKFNSLFAMTQYFTTDDICKQTIVESRWMQEDGTIDVVCPYCGEHHCVTRKENESYRFTDMFCKSIGLIVKWTEIKKQVKKAA